MVKTDEARHRVFRREVEAELQNLYGEAERLVSKYADIDMPSMSDEELVDLMVQFDRKLRYMDVCMRDVKDAILEKAFYDTKNK